jgi:hypothetical protein
MPKCFHIKNQIFVEPNGLTTYCCESVPHDTPQRKLFDLNSWDEKRTYELDLFNKSKSKEWLTECLLCKYSEDKFGYSMRTGGLNFYPNSNHIIKAIIKTSNLCNLACRMCSPDLSTTWQYNIKDNSSKEFYSNVNKYKLVEISKKQLELLKKRVLTEHLRFLIFSGGEVLLSEHNYKIMQYLLEMGYYNMEVHITTNGTTKIKDAWLESANKFKQFNLEVSIDGAGSVYNYIRAGGDWNTLIDVITYTKQVAPNINWIFNYVAQALNAHSIKNDEEQIMELFHDVELDGGGFKDHVSVCHTDPEDSYAVIHPEFRKKYGIEHWADTFEYDPTIFATFMRKQSWLDNMHGTSLEELNPDFFNEDIYPKQAIDEYRRN